MEGGKEGRREGGREVWLQLRKDYAVLLLWKEVGKTQEGGKRGREGGREGGRVRLFIFRPGVIRYWDQRKEATEAAKEEERRARKEVVVQEGGRGGGGEEGREVVVAGWGIRTVPALRKREDGKEGRTEVGREGRTEGNNDKSQLNYNNAPSHCKDRVDEEEEPEGEKGEEGEGDDAALLHLATHGSFTHPLVLPPCPKCQGPTLMGFYQHERRKGNGGYRELGRFVQALPLKVKRSLPLVTPYCPRCEGGPAAPTAAPASATAAIAATVPPAAARSVQVSYRYLG